ncbi:Endoglin antigen [Schistosoma japonicum]|nr:Endoglin antigen [Schistosoma japonicum]
MYLSWKYNLYRALTCLHSNKPTFVGCTCELIPTTTSSITPTNYEISKRDHLCSLNLPDIGDECDHSNLVCRSRSAKCVSKGSSIKKVCTCPGNTVAVYQSFLNYFECFPVIKRSISFKPSTKHVVNDYCQHCQKINGTCYDQNNDGIPDGCQCPPSRSFIQKIDQHGNSRNTAVSINSIQHNDELIFPCELEHLKTKCDEHKLTVCYLPHFSGRFQTLPYYLRMNIVHISLVQLFYGELLKDEESCSLNSQLKSTANAPSSKKRFPLKDDWHCVTLLNNQFSMNKCTVNVNIDPICDEINNTQILKYSGNVYIQQTNQIHLNGKTLLEIPWECTAKKICNMKPKPTINLTNQQIQNDLGQLCVMNKNSEIITEIGEGELVYLQIMSKCEQFIINTKMCAAASIKFPENINSKSAIDERLCQAFYHFKFHITEGSTVNSYHNQTILISDLPVSIHYNNTSFNQQSEMFPAFQIIPQQTIVYYICLVSPVIDSVEYRLESRAIRDWCGASDKYTRLSSASHLFFTKLIISSSTSPHHIKCTLLSCLNMNQLTFICCSLLLMNLVACVILICMYKRKQQSKRHEIQYDFSYNPHSEQLLNDSLKYSMLSTTTPQEIAEIHQQPIYYNEFGTYLNHEYCDEFEPPKDTNCPKCIAFKIKQINPLLSTYQTTRGICQVMMENSSKQLPNKSPIHLSLLNGQSITTLQKCRQEPMSETLENKPAPIKV